MNDDKERTQTKDGSPLPLNQKKVEWGTRQLWMNYGQSKVFFECVEITIAMQQRMFFQQAETGDKTVNRFAHRTTASSQDTVIRRSRYREFDASGFENLKFEQIAAHPVKGCVAIHTLQHLAKNDVSQPKPLPAQLTVEPGGVGVPGAAQIIDPDCCIDDHHAKAYDLMRAARD